MRRARPAVVRQPAGGVPLTFEIECLTSRTARNGARHAVRLHPDGSFEAPHDMGAERIATAFGGYCSCLDIADTALPALTEAVGLVTRRLRPTLRRRADGRWSVPRVVACGCPSTFGSAAAASPHAPGVRHLAARHRCAERLVGLILDGVEAAVTGPRTPLHAELRARVREQGGLARLWAAGLHPDDAGDWAAVAATITEPLPSSYYLGFAYNRPEAEFIAATIPARPDGDTAAWLAWLPPEHRRTDECRALLAAGLPRDDVVAFLEAGMPPERLAALAVQTGIARDVVAHQVATWLRAGCVLEASHLELVMAHGLQTHRPSAAALDHLEEAAAAGIDPPSRTELGVIQALVGGRGAVLQALDRGVRSAAELVERLAHE